MMIAEHANTIHAPSARSLARSAPCVFSWAGGLHSRENTQMSNLIKVTTGDLYGRLTVIEETAGHHRPNGRLTRRFRCQCECGNHLTVTLCNLRTGNTSSCGCLRRDTCRIQGKLAATHNMSHTPAYRSWHSMQQRCTDPRKHNYHRYGGRGISVCQRWMDSFEAFLEDMGEKPAGLTIERIDNDKGYSKSNCRWATAKEQARNRQNSVFVTYQGETLCLGEWAERTGIALSTLHKRFRLGWSAERAFTTPVNVNMRRTK